MCLGVPMRIVSLNGFVAKCEAKGVKRDVNLLMMQDERFQEGDYLIADRGFAIQKLTEEEAESAWKLFDEILQDPRNKS